MNEEDVVQVADGYRIEKFGDDVFFLDIEGAGHRTINRNDEYIIWRLLAKLHGQMKP